MADKAARLRAYRNETLAFAEALAALCRERGFRLEYAGCGTHGIIIEPWDGEGNPLEDFCDVDERIEDATRMALRAAMIQEQEAARKEAEREADRKAGVELL